MTHLSGVESRKKRPRGIQRRHPPGSWSAWRTGLTRTSRCSIFYFGLPLQAKPLLLGRLLVLVMSLISCSRVSMR